MAPDDPDYWQPPKAHPIDAWPGDPPSRPRVYTWFIVYCVVIACLAAVLMVAGVGLLAFGASIPDLDDEERVMMPILGAVYGFMGLVGLTLFAIGPLVPKRPWGWVYGLVLICLGLTGCPTIFAAIPLLIYWIKPETRAFFGKT